MNKLSTNKLSKTFKSRQVVRDVSIEVSSGEIIGLLGPNGAGKTTSFYMIVGLIPVDSGSVLMNDQPITNLAVHVRAKKGLAYLPQEASIFRKLNVKQNILAILEQRNDLNKKERKEKVEQLLNDLSISHIANNKGYSLSGGERRRVEIARTLALQPKFILFDEPFAGIDPISMVDIKEIIQKLAKQGIGILITDHNVRETLNICERAYIVNEGEIISHGTPTTILANEKVRSVYLGKEFSL